MKVLMINSVCGIRSTGRICTDIAEMLEDSGHKCKIAYGRESFVPEKYKKYAIRIGTEFDVKLHAIGSRIFDNAGFGSKHATEKFVEWVRIYNPDIIHLHNIHGYYINIELLFRFLTETKKPVVWTLHDCWAFTGHCSHFSYVKCMKWKTGCHDCPQKTRYPTSYIFDRSKRNWENKNRLFSNIDRMTLVTPSNWLAGLVNESFLDKYPIKVIPNGIDLNVFSPISSDFREQYGLVNKKIVLGVASIWDERKGLSDFIKLSEALDESHKIVLVGLSKKQRENLPTSIISIARTNSMRELAEIYSAADVFVNPSLEETMGLTSIEAMACGTPSIVYDATALPEFLNDKCGIVANCNPNSILSALAKINHNTYACKKQAREYDKTNQYSKYINLYRDLI